MLNGGHALVMNSDVKQLFQRRALPPRLKKKKASNAGTTFLVTSFKNVTRLVEVLRQFSKGSSSVY